jgi:hypothetical protein
MTEKKRERKRVRKPAAAKGRATQAPEGARPAQRARRIPAIPPIERSLLDPGRPPDVLSAREKSTGKGKKTADKWNQ